MEQSSHDNHRVKSRYNAFIEVAKGKFLYLLLLGFLLVLSAAAIVTFRYLCVMQEIELNEAVAQGTLTASQALLDVNALDNLYYLICLPLSLLLALIVSGGAKVVKCFAWRENTTFRENLGEGIKENFLRFALCFAFNVVLLWMNNFVRNSTLTPTVFHFLPTVCWFLFCLPVSLWFCSATAVYKEKLLKTIANSIRLYCLSLPYSFVGVVLLIAPLALVLVPIAWFQEVIPLLYLLLYLPFALLGWTYIANKVFDKQINQGSFPHLVNKGLL